MCPYCFHEQLPPKQEQFNRYVSEPQPCAGCGSVLPVERPIEVYGWMYYYSPWNTEN